jgi:hypothetical protein
MSSQQVTIEGDCSAKRKAPQWSAACETKSALSQRTFVVSLTEHVSLCGPGGAGAAVHVMMGVVTTRGDAAMAHIENSVLYSVAVIVPSLPFACAACA